MKCEVLDPNNLQVPKSLLGESSRTWIHHVKFLYHPLKVKSFRLELMFMFILLFSCYCAAFDLGSVCVIVRQ